MAKCIGLQTRHGAGDVGWPGDQQDTGRLWKATIFQSWQAEELCYPLPRVQQTPGSAKEELMELGLPIKNLQVIGIRTVSVWRTRSGWGRTAVKGPSQELELVWEGSRRGCEIILSVPGKPLHAQKEKALNQHLHCHWVLHRSFYSKSCVILAAGWNQIYTIQKKFLSQGCHLDLVKHAKHCFLEIPV